MNRRVIVLVGMLWLVPAGTAFAVGTHDDRETEVAGIDASSVSPGLDSIAETSSSAEQRTSGAQGLAATSGPPDPFRSVVGMGAGLAVLIVLATMAGHRLERQGG